ncbi:putative glycosyl transferase, family 8, nucleotide-diphospho-sugar transferase [Septoria linicola]|nr:putative glycosyl transferase, family 8, nucleotide-diphospho-sugar transferase [Septoria linicola]
MAGLEDVYCTLVLSDSYVAGAAVLAHSLRDCGTTKKLACLIVQNSLQTSTIEELQSLFNYVIPVEAIGNPHPGNLYLMNRPDLLYTFTKINLWRQTQFRKIVYIDADVVALRAPEELFDIAENFAAAPDVGWPDAFNTGVMVLTPNMGEYYALRGLANAGDSFDGADQGLLNQYYEHRPWKRLSFTYNTTPSANYQYEPAYRYWKHGISMVHFIGKNKPWQRGREEHGAPGAFQEMLSRWWAVYDRHFQVSASETAPLGDAMLRNGNQTSEYTNGRRNAVRDHVPAHNPNAQEPAPQSYYASGYPASSTQDQHATGTATPLMTEPGEPVENIDQGRVQPAPTSEQRRFSAPHMEWDATRGAPPIESRPEAANFPSQTYEFNSDPTPFRAPKAYPQPPRDMYYQVPPPAVRKAEEQPKPIFPWEERAVPKPTRRFLDDEVQPPPPELESESAYIDELEVTSNTRAEPPTPTIKINDVDPWAAFAQNRNAWDDVNGINNYVRALTSFQKNRGQVQVVQSNVPSTGYSAPPGILSPGADPEDLVQQVEDARERRESLILTDFPSAIERPSLPVTPAPKRRSFWGDERDAAGDLPPAEGVPDQADWNPDVSLEHLRRTSLIGPGDLKFPEKRLSNREMPSTAISMPQDGSHDSQTYARNNASGTLNSQRVSSTEANTSHGFDGSLQTLSFSERSFSSATSSSVKSAQSAETIEAGSTASSTTMPGGFPGDQGKSVFFAEPGFTEAVVVDEAGAEDFQSEDPLSPTQEHKTL